MCWERRTSGQRGVGSIPKAFHQLSQRPTDFRYSAWHHLNRTVFLIATESSCRAAVGGVARLVPTSNAGPSRKQPNKLRWAVRDAIGRRSLPPASLRHNSRRRWHRLVLTRRGAWRLCRCWCCKRGCTARNLANLGLVDDRSELP